MEKSAYTAWSLAIRNRGLYDKLRWLSAQAQRPITAGDGMIHRLPFPFSGWTRSRDIKPLARQTFMSHWEKVRKS
jgi:L-lactate dehydrogenase complex protein LldF